MQNSEHFKSPYLSSSHRLPDILAAIQVMGSQRWDSREIKDWVTTLGPEPQSALSWEALFTDHPEFFGSTPRSEGGTYYFLRLRRSYERTVDPDDLRELSNQEIKQLKDSGKYVATKLCRKSLAPSQVEALMKTAIELQVRAAALQDRSRWWIPVASAVLAFVGATLGSLLKAI